MDVIYEYCLCTKCSAMDKLPKPNLEFENVFILLFCYQKDMQEDIQILMRALYKYKGIVLKRRDNVLLLNIYI